MRLIIVPGNPSPNQYYKMSNIAQIKPETATPEQTEVFANVKKAMGMVPNLVATLAQWECKNVSVNWKSATSLKEPPLG